MMTPKLRSPGETLKAKAHGAVIACVPAATPLVEIFTGPAHPLNTRRNDGEGEGFFFFTFEGLSSIWLLFYQRFGLALPLWSSPDLSTANSQCFIRDDARTFVPTIPRRRPAFTVSLNVEVFVHSCEQCGHFFFTRRPLHQFPLPGNLHRHSRRAHFQQDETCCLLDRRHHESHQTYSSYQFVSHLLFMSISSQVLVAFSLCFLLYLEMTAFPFLKKKKYSESHTKKNLGTSTQRCFPPFRQKPREA